MLPLLVLLPNTLLIPSLWPFPLPRSRSALSAGLRERAKGCRFGKAGACRTKEQGKVLVNRTFGLCAMADNDGKSRKSRPTNLWFPFLLIAICIVVEYLNSRNLPVQGNLQRRAGGDSTETFRVANARSNLNELTAFGPRVTGSGVNEVTIPQYIQRKVHEIARDLPAGAAIEVDRQNPASNFYLDFLGGITNVSAPIYKCCRPPR